MAGATFTRVTTWIAGDTLTANALNGEFDNILNNLLPSGIDDESATTAAARATSDPYAAATLVPATSLQAEIQQLRYLIAQITGESYWYIDPDASIATIYAAQYSLPAGTKMWFYQNTAPTGWTLDSTPADALLAVKGGSQAYNVEGGNQAGTWTQPDHTLTTAEMPAHTHTVVSYSGAPYGNPTMGSYVLTLTGISNVATTSAGTGGAHNHGTTYRPLAQVGIIATKD